MTDSLLGRTPERPASTAWRFHPVLGSRVHEKVIDQITFAVRAGVLRPGDRLPRIEELARIMNVSRPTVGAAVKALSDAGVLRAQRGATGGVTIVSDNIPVTMMRMAAGWREAALVELTEARRPIEMALAQLAGKRATDRDLETIRASVAKLEDVRNDSNRSRWTNFDHLFHYGIGRAAKSEMLAYYQHQILEQLAVILKEYYANELEDRDLVLDTHRETLAALESRDPEEIRVAMDRHLTNLENIACEWAGGNFGGNHHRGAVGVVGGDERSR